MFFFNIPAVIFVFVCIIAVSCKERIPRAVSEEDYAELWKLLEGGDIVAMKRVYTPLEKRVYRLYKSSISVVSVSN